MSRRTERIILIALVLVAAYVGAWAVFEQNTPPALKDGGTAPDIGIRAASGPVKLSDLKGKVVLIDFWATWCGPCRMSIPGIEKAYKKYSGRGFVALGVSVDDDPSGVPQFIKDMGMTYPAGLILDKNQYPPYNKGSIPLMVLVDRKGHIRWTQNGYSLETDEILNQLINDLLKE